MSSLTDMNNLPPDVDLALDRLLADWSEQLWNDLKLDEAPIAHDVIVHAEDLGYDWWSQFVAHMPFHTAKAV